MKICLRLRVRESERVRKWELRVTCIWNLEGLIRPKSMAFPQGTIPTSGTSGRRRRTRPKNKNKKKAPSYLIRTLIYFVSPNAIRQYTCLSVQLYQSKDMNDINDNHFSPGEQCRAVLDLIGLNALVFMTFFVYLLFFKFFKFFFLLCFGASLSITWCLYKGQGEISSAYYFLGWIALSKEQQSLVRPGCPFFFPLLKFFFLS